MKIYKTKGKIKAQDLIKTLGFPSNTPKKQLRAYVPDSTFITFDLSGYAYHIYPSGANKRDKDKYSIIYRHLFQGNAPNENLIKYAYGSYQECVIYVLSRGSKLGKLLL